MYATTADEFTALGVAQILVDSFIPTWGCPAELLSDIGPKVCAELSHLVYRTVYIKELASSPFYAMRNGGTEPVDYIVAQMLA